MLFPKSVLGKKGEGDTIVLDVSVVDFRGETGFRTKGSGRRQPGGISPGNRNLFEVGIFRSQPKYFP